MSKPNEITEAVLKSRIRDFVTNLDIAPDVPTNAMVDMIYDYGNFAEFVGVVERTTTAIRQEGAAIARRHNHHVTAEKIRKGPHK
jgi:hypothetical protein